MAGRSHNQPGTQMHLVGYPCNEGRYNYLWESTGVLELRGPGSSPSWGLQSPVRTMELMPPSALAGC